MTSTDPGLTAQQPKEAQMGKHSQDASHQSGGDQKSAGTLANILKWERQQHGQGIDTDNVSKAPGRHRASMGDSNIRSHKR